MCGIAGWRGPIAPDKRDALAIGLAVGTDTRGGHACGYAASFPLADRVHLARHSGKWSGLKTQTWGAILNTISDADSVLMHARYATCGIARDPQQAHPYRVKHKSGRHIYMMHNGVVDDARDSARAHKRDFVTDSLEIAHLLAAEAWAEIATLEGYGTLAWLDTERHVRLVRASDDAALAIARVGEATVWASTEEIIRRAVDAAGLKVDTWYKQAPVGVQLLVTREGIMLDESAPKVKFAERRSYSFSTYGNLSDWYYSFLNDRPSRSRKSSRRRKGDDVPWWCDPKYGNDKRNPADTPGLRSASNPSTAAMREAGEAKLLDAGLLDDEPPSGWNSRGGLSTECFGRVTGSCVPEDEDTPWCMFCGELIDEAHDAVAARALVE